MSLDREPRSGTVHPLVPILMCVWPTAFVFGAIGSGLAYVRESRQLDAFENSTVQEQFVSVQNDVVKVHCKDPVTSIEYRLDVPNIDAYIAARNAGCKPSLNL